MGFKEGSGGKDQRYLLKIEFGSKGSHVQQSSDDEGSSSGHPPLVDGIGVAGKALRISFNSKVCVRSRGRGGNRASAFSRGRRDSASRSSGRGSSSSSGRHGSCSQMSGHRGHVSGICVVTHFNGDRVGDYRHGRGSKNAGARSAGRLGGGRGTRGGRGSQNTGGRGIWHGANLQRRQDLPSGFVFRHHGGLDGSRIAHEPEADVRVLEGVAHVRDGKDIAGTVRRHLELVRGEFEAGTALDPQQQALELLRSRQFDIATLKGHSSWLRD